MEIYSWDTAEYIQGVIVEEAFVESWRQSSEVCMSPGGAGNIPRPLDSCQNINGRSTFGPPSSVPPSSRLPLSPRSRLKMRMQLSHSQPPAAPPFPSSLLPRSLAPSSISLVISCSGAGTEGCVGLGSFSCSYYPSLLAAHGLLSSLAASSPPPLHSLPYLPL